MVRELRMENHLSSEQDNPDSDHVKIRNYHKRRFTCTEQNS